MHRLSWTREGMDKEGGGRSMVIITTKGYGTTAKEGERRDGRKSLGQLGRVTVPVIPEAERL